MLIIDKREKDAILIALLEAECEKRNIEYKEENLDVGDFLWDDTNICIEHKSTEDFKASLASNHLDSQILDLKANYEHGYLFIEGKWSFGKQRFGKPFYPAQRNGKLISIISRSKVPYFYAETQSQLVDAIFQIHEAITVKGQKSDIITRHTHTANKNNPTINMYASLDGMGEQKIKALLEIYPTFGSFINDYTTYGMDWMRRERGITKQIINKTTEKYLLSLWVQPCHSESAETSDTAQQTDTTS